MVKLHITYLHLNSQQPKTPFTTFKEWEPLPKSSCIPVISQTQTNCAASKWKTYSFPWQKEMCFYSRSIRHLPLHPRLFHFFFPPLPFLVRSGGHALVLFQRSPPFLHVRTTCFPVTRGPFGNGLQEVSHARFFFFQGPCFNCYLWGWVKVKFLCDFVRGRGNTCTMSGMEETLFSFVVDTFNLFVASNVYVTAF